jgi:hypothetical protein
MLDLGPVAFDGFATDAEAGGDLPFAEAGTQEFENAQFAIGEALEASAGRL